jgi:hypothetical protein
MVSQQSKEEKNLIKAVYPSRPDWIYYLPKPDKVLVKKLAVMPVFPDVCERPCTKVLTLFPKTTVSGHTGRGYYVMNIDGYRIINAYVISDALNSTLQRGFTLAISFSLNPFVEGTGVIGETSYFYNFENYFNPGTFSQRTLRCETNDLTTTGGLPWIGGTDLTHILRVPVMGPYVRASVFNEDSQARQVEVKAYLTT